MIVEQVLDDYARHLSVRRGLSDHTTRAYLGDIRALLGGRRRPGAGLDVAGEPSGPVRSGPGTAPRRRSLGRHPAPPPVGPLDSAAQFQQAER